jgi:hypothetical protein
MVVLIRISKMDGLTMDSCFESISGLPFVETGGYFIHFLLDVVTTPY